MQVKLPETRARLASTSKCNIRPEYFPAHHRLIAAFASFPDKIIVTSELGSRTTLSFTARHKPYRADRPMTGAGKYCIVYAGRDVAITMEAQDLCGKKLTARFHSPPGEGNTYVIRSASKY